MGGAKTVYNWDEVTSSLELTSLTITYGYKANGASAVEVKNTSYEHHALTLADCILWDPDASVIVNGGIEAEETVKEYLELAKCSYTNVSGDPDTEVVKCTVG